MVSDGYFDSLGSQIYFTLSEHRGKVYLQQTGDSHGVNAAASIGLTLGYVRVTWYKQAQNLRNLLGVPEPPFLTPGYH